MAFELSLSSVAHDSGNFCAFLGHPKLLFFTFEMGTDVPNIALPRDLDEVQRF